MRVIALEEAFAIPGLERVGIGRDPAIAAKLADLGASRIADMDAAGIDVQVLSAAAPGPNPLDPADAVSVARTANDTVAEAVAAHPGRFAGFATLPTPDPEAAAAELERCVRVLGFKGTLIHGHTKGRFLDAPEFRPILEAAQHLDVPIYIHPTMPPAEVMNVYFGGLPGQVAHTLAGSGWGWHAETGLHALRLIASGTMDRYPGLKIIIGHMGENLPFSLARADKTLNPVAGLPRRISEYFTANFYVTTSGYFTVPPFQCAMSVLGIDRLLFSVDYPFADNAAARQFLDTLPISEPDREKLAHGNAERLLGLPPATS